MYCEPFVIIVSAFANLPLEVTIKTVTEKAGPKREYEFSVIPL